MAFALRAMSRKAAGDVGNLPTSKEGTALSPIGGITKSHRCDIAADATGVASVHMKPMNRSIASLFTNSTSNPNVKEPAMNKVETQEDNFEESVRPLRSSISRRSFLGKSIAVGAGTMGAGLWPRPLRPK